MHLRKKRNWVKWAQQLCRKLTKSFLLFLKSNYTEVSLFDLLTCVVGVEPFHILTPQGTRLLSYIHPSRA
jgi:hypothetical protein